MRLRWVRFLFSLSIPAAVCALALCWVASAKEYPRQNCAAYEDALIRFKCPAAWKTWFYEGSPAEEERAWYVHPPDEEKSDLAKIYIIEKLGSYEKPPLEQRFAETKKNAHKMTILEDPKKIAIVGAKCLSFKWDSIRMLMGNALGPDGRPRIPRVYAHADAYCYNKRGNYVEISSQLSFYEPKKPDERYKKNAAVFDSFLKTVEFK